MGNIVLICVGGILLLGGVIIGFGIFLPVGLVMIGFGFYNLLFRKKSLRDGYKEKKIEIDEKAILKKEQKIYSGKNSSQINVINYFYKPSEPNEITDDNFIDYVHSLKENENLDDKVKNLCGYPIDTITEDNMHEISGFVPAKEQFDVVDGQVFASKELNGELISTRYQTTYLVFNEAKMFYYQYSIDLDKNNNQEKYDWINFREVINLNNNQNQLEIKTMAGKTFNIDLSNAKQGALIKQYIVEGMQASRG